ncbi:MAG: hypothetical protein IJW71_00100 [Clostridia bacterium]|nr:hypothetical protein [Clostridia bacterium]
MNPDLEIKMLSSLAKVFPDRNYGGEEKETVSAAGQETCFQLAMRRMVSTHYSQCDYEVTVDSALSEYITLSRVGYVPSELSAYPGEGWCDDYYLTLAAGVYPIAITVTEGDKIEELTYTLTVKPFALPAQSFTFAQWFHTDCVANVHYVPICSEELGA